MKPIDDRRIEVVGMLIEAHADLVAALERDLGTSIPIPFLGVLIRLARSPDGEKRMTELARDMSMSTSGLTRLIDRIETAGLVERRACKTDRRGLNARITKAGLKELDRVLPCHLDSVESRMTSHLTDAQIDQLIDLLRIVRDAAKAARLALVSLIEIDIADGVALVTLNDPDRRNALNLEICAEMIRIFDDLEARPDDVGAVVVTGAGSAFCAGADLSHLGSSREEGLRGVYEGFLRVGRSPLPTIAAVNGAAVGAGMNLALCCDLRLAAERARFDTRFIQLGLHPGGGHTWMFRNITGPQATFATVVFGEILDGKEAERCGLVWRCVPDGELLDTARTMAQKAANGPRQLVRKVKESIDAMATIDDHAAAVDRELEPQLWSLDQPDFAERLKALQSKISSN